MRLQMLLLHAACSMRKIPLEHLQVSIRRANKSKQAHSLQTALLLLRAPSVRLDVSGSSRPDWHLRHLANLL
jgi:hypothetical protein